GKVVARDATALAGGALAWRLPRLAQSLAPLPLRRIVAILPIRDLRTLMRGGHLGPGHAQSNGGRGNLSALVVPHSQLRHSLRHGVPRPPKLVPLPGLVLERHCQIRLAPDIAPELGITVRMECPDPLLVVNDLLEVLARILCHAAVKAQRLGRAVFRLQPVGNGLALPLWQLCLPLHGEVHGPRNLDPLTHSILSNLLSASRSASATRSRSIFVIPSASRQSPLAHGPRRSLISARTLSARRSSSPSTISASMTSGSSGSDCAGGEAESANSRAPLIVVCGPISPSSMAWSSRSGSALVRATRASREGGKLFEFE